MSIDCVVVLAWQTLFPYLTPEALMKPFISVNFFSIKRGKLLLESSAVLNLTREMPICQVHKKGINCCSCEGAAGFHFCVS